MIVAVAVILRAIAGVIVLMVQIRRVIVAVRHGFVAMGMRVFAEHRRDMTVQVMAVVVSMGVFMFEDVMPMCVLVSLGQVQVRAQGEERH